MKQLDTDSFSRWLETTVIEIGAAEWQAVCPNCAEHPRGVCDACALEIAERNIGGLDIYAAR